MEATSMEVDREGFPAGRGVRETAETAGYLVERLTALMQVGAGTQAQEEQSRVLTEIPDYPVLSVITRDHKGMSP
jgi:hypothetical protein